MKTKIIFIIFIFNCFLSFSEECISGNCYDGFGKIRYENGQEYIGEFKNGDPNGYGKTLYSNGHVFIGEFINGKKNGYGVYLWKNGNVFFGKFKNGKEDGYAIKKEKRHASISGSRYLINEWENGEIIKKSIKVIDNSKFCQIGECDKNQKTGIFSKNGKTIIGNLSKGIRFTIDDPNNIFIGKFNENEKLQKGLVASLKPSSDLKLINKKSGTWTSYHVYSNKLIYLKNWINEKMIEEVLIDNVNTKITSPPSLIIEDVVFDDFNSNNLLEANEEARISFNIKNIGNGSAYAIDIQISENNNIKGISYVRNKQVNILKPKKSINISIPLSASMSLLTGESNFNITISEGNGFDANPIELLVPTQCFIAPSLEIVDFVFISDVGEMKLGEKVNLQFAVQNIGQGIAEDIQIKMIIPENVFATDETNYSIDKLSAGEKKLYNFNFFTNKRFNDSVLNITAQILEKYKKYAKDKLMSVNIKEDISDAIALKVESNVSIEKINIDRFSLTSNVDKNIPVNKKVNSRFALVIGNEDYSTYQMGLKNEQNVDYAINDAKIFKEYALKTLGVKDENLFMRLNATSGSMSQEINRIIKLTESEKENAELIIYYAGHGFPDEITKIPYLIPVDVSGSDLSRAINLNNLYQRLGKLKAKKITIFLDACFTGGGRKSGLIASRGVKVKPKEGSLSGNLVVFTSSSEDQSSLPLDSENHGIFTYHILKKFQETSGKISYGEFFDQIKSQVSKTALRGNKAMEQVPNVLFSPKIHDEWYKWKF